MIESLVRLSDHEFVYGECAGFQVHAWTVVKEMNCEGSSHGKMCGDWVIIDKCEVLIAYCANCELMID